MWFFGRKNPSAEEVTQGIDGTGLTAIVTGASSGIGAETTRVLALRGVHVIMAVRNLDVGRQVKDRIVKEIPFAKVDIMKCDLSSMASVRKFTSDFKSSNLPLNLLINNAGIYGVPYTLSQDNIELNFATNHLGHFLLTYLLLDTMKNTTKQSGREGRIVNVSSEAHRYTTPVGISFDKLNQPSWYNFFLAYSRSKLANILHANELARLLKEDGVKIIANSVHPGVIYTNIFRYAKLANGVFDVLSKFILKDVSQGAATTCFVGLHPDVRDVSGQYFSDCTLSKPSYQAKDAILAQKLWDFSMDLIKQC